MRISDWSSDVCSSDLDDLPPGGRHLLAHGEVPRAHGRLAALQSLHVLHEVAEAIDAASPAGFDDLALQEGIGGKEVGWREDIEDLPCRGLDHVLVVPAHPADPGGRSVPPLLVQQESLDDQVEGRLFPCRIGEPAVLAQRFDRGGGTRIAERSEEHTSELQSLMRHSSAVFCLKKKKKQKSTRKNENNIKTKKQKMKSSDEYSIRNKMCNTRRYKTIYNHNNI